MFVKSIVALASILAFSSTVSAAPTVKRSSYHPVSFNYYGGYNELGHFDDFYGADNYSGYHNNIVVDHEKEVVCHSQKVEIIQQQLAVLREYVKKIVTERICEVEVQTLVYTQFVSGLHDFSSDIRREGDSDRHVGYDGEIASHISDIHDGSGEISDHDLGFHGSDIGSHYIVPSGNNWNKDSSPSIVGSAYNLALSASGHR